MSTPENWPFNSKGAHGNADLPHSDDLASEKKDEFPKWVSPHESHVERNGDVVSVPTHEFHIGRGGALTVLVVDEEDERRITAAKEGHDGGAIVPAAPEEVV